jgi:outer membrane lipoprotein SlyB
MPFASLTAVARGIVTHTGIRDIEIIKHKELIMKRIQQSALMASLVALVLGACSSTDSNRTAMSSSANPTTASEASRSGEAAQDISQDASRNTTATGGSATTSGSSSIGASGTPSGSSNTQMGSSATTGSNTAPDQSSYASSSMTAPTNSVVTAIEVIPRQSSGVGTGSMAGAAVGGSTGTTSGADQVYRITLRMDDGSTKVITQESTPVFKSGDRVRMSNDMIQTQPQR